ncbi:MAG: hypothetical protein PF442_10940 [Desulfobulbaceae bacterium]|jgi:hypothetical protein|nr:hypothetical protein [Desulfobulbaceae bacterium]
MRQFYLITMAILALLFHGGPVSAGHETNKTASHAGGHGEQTPVTMETIVVTGERLDEYIVNHPQLVTVLDQEAILQGNYLDLGEAIGSMALGSF